MKFKIANSPLWQPYFANDNDCYSPEVWSAESLMVLYENLVIAQLVHRDFSKEIAKQGDVVNTRRPAKFTSTRKVDTDSVTTSDAQSTNVAVNLNQHHHVSFVIKDGEDSKGMKSLVEIYLEPAVIAIAQAIDEMLNGEKYSFIENTVGSLGTALTKATVIALGVKMTENVCPEVGRNFVISPATKGDLQNVDEFTHAEKIGDAGSALRTGSLGEILGFRTHMSHNCKSVTASDVVTGAINNGTGYAAGAVTATVDGLSAAITAGTWFTVAGDMTPQCVTSTVGGATPTSITFTPGLASAVVDNAVVTLYEPAHVNLGAGYAADWAKAIVIDNCTLAPKTGQMMSIGTVVGASTLVEYGLMSTPTTIVLLPNKPLAAAVVDNADLNLGPAGDYNFAFHKNALCLVSRPLALPRTNLADGYVAVMDGIGIRVVITYDGKAQGHRVTVDLLCGVKMLDVNLGCIALS